MDTSNMVKVSKSFLKESFERGLEKKAWMLYADFDGEFSSGTTVTTANEVEEFTTKRCACPYWISLESV